ncbi:MAG: MFS transporter, partial [Actinomycetota bacterium]|nr:MFS transporter [Actinomycetota bacterium]
MAETSTRSTPNLGAAADGLSSRARIWLLAVASMDVLLVISSMVALNAALPDIAVQTSASQSQLTWIVDGYTLALACLLLPAGAVGDRYGRRGARGGGVAVVHGAARGPPPRGTP